MGFVPANQLIKLPQDSQNHFSATPELLPPGVQVERFFRFQTRFEAPLKNTTSNWQFSPGPSPSKGMLVILLSIGIRKPAEKFRRHWLLGGHQRWHFPKPPLGGVVSKNSRTFGIPRRRHGEKTVRWEVLCVNARKSKFRANQFQRRPDCKSSFLNR